MQGILNVNKPQGVTSFGVIASVKKLISERRIGHAGTLDPFATGVLPILLGRATRIAEYLMDLHKVYLAEIELGKTTDTDDIEGKVIALKDFSGINEEKLKSALKDFTGGIMQVPPLYSALKHRGKPLYEFARSGIAVERKARRVEIFRLELIEFQPPIVTVEVECSKGTYIRSLAHDLGEALGCGAYLKALARTRYGPLDIGDAVSLAELEEAIGQGKLEQLIYPMDAVLGNMRAVTLDNEKTEMAKHGQTIALENIDSSTSGERVRAYTPGGTFLAILRFDADKKQWCPEKVFV